MEKHTRDLNVAALTDEHCREAESILSESGAEPARLYEMSGCCACASREREREREQWKPES